MLSSSRFLQLVGIALAALPSLAAARQDSLAPPTPAAASEISTATGPVAPAPTAVLAPTSAPPLASAPPARSATLARGAPLLLMLNTELSTKANKIGDPFEVTLLSDVVDGPNLVIPKGALGRGEVTFRAGTGGFGRAGMLMITLRTLDLGDRTIALDGRYREEGNNNNGATVATWVAVGVFSGFIKGKTGVIPKGRELKARTGEDIAYVPGVPATAPAALQIERPAAPETPSNKTGT